MEIKKLGNLNGFSGGNFAYMVYDASGISPTITAHSGGGTEPHVIEKVRDKNKADSVGGGYEIELIPCNNCKSKDGKFLSSSEMTMKNLGKELANTVCARYYKGIEGDNADAVIVHRKGLADDL